MESKKIILEGISIDVSANVKENAVDHAIRELYSLKMKLVIDNFDQLAMSKPLPKKLRKDLVATW